MRVVTLKQTCWTGYSRVNIAIRLQADKYDVSPRVLLTETINLRKSWALMGLQLLNLGEQGLNLVHLQTKSVNYSVEFYR